MRLLRLTNSNDYNDEIPELLRGEAITRRLAAEAIGEDVETVSRAFWPSSKLPAKVAGWLDEYEPDMVFIRCAAYWVSFESLPLRIDRTLGRLGRWPAAVGKRLGSEPTVAQTGRQSGSGAGPCGPSGATRTSLLARQPDTSKLSSGSSWRESRRSPSSGARAMPTTPQVRRAASDGHWRGTVNSTNNLPHCAPGCGWPTYQPGRQQRWRSRWGAMTYTVRPPARGLSPNSSRR